MKAASMTKRVTRTRWIVTEEGAPTRFERTADTFGAAILGRKKRILVKCHADAAHRFLSESLAQNEATRRRLLGDFLRQSMVSDLPSIQKFVKRGEFQVVPVARKQRKNKNVTTEPDLF